MAYYDNLIIGSEGKLQGATTTKSSSDASKLTVSGGTATPQVADLYSGMINPNSTNFNILSKPYTVPSTVPSAAFNDTPSTTPANPSADIQTEISNITGGSQPKLGEVAISGSYNASDYKPGSIRFTSDGKVFGTPVSVVSSDVGTDFVNPNAGMFNPPAVSGGTPVSTTGTATAPTEKIQEGRTGLFEQFKTIFGFGEDKASAADRAAEILPETPPELLKLDSQQAELDAQYQEASNGIQDQAGRGLRFIEGDQRRLNREYEAQSARIQGRRAAIAGDFDRATERAVLILDIEKEDRDELLKQQMMALSLLESEVEGEEAIYLAQYKNELEKQLIESERLYDTAQEKLSGVSDIMKSNPEAFQAYYAAGGEDPKTALEAAKIAAQYYQAPTKKDTTPTSVTERQLEALSGYDAVFQPEAVSPISGELILNEEGFATPEAWKEIVGNLGPVELESFLKRYGWRVDKELKEGSFWTGGARTAKELYGMTDAEWELIGGK